MPMTELLESTGTVWEGVFCVKPFEEPPSEAEVPAGVASSHGSSVDTTGVCASSQGSDASGCAAGTANAGDAADACAGVEVDGICGFMLRGVSI